MASTRANAAIFAISAFLAGLMLLDPGIASSQNYPAKPIRIVTSLGGAGDFMSRLIAQEISGPLGQSVIVETRVSAVRAELVAQATPDGYTLLVGGSSTWITQLLQKVSYDVVKDLAPITMVESFPFVVAVHSSAPVKSITELIAWAKSRPGELNYGSGGTGSGTHLGPELFKAMAGVNIVRVPYPGGVAAVNSILGGETQLTFLAPGTVLPHVKSGRLRALAVTSAQQSELAPGLPTVAATGLPGFETVSATAMWAPARTPATIITQLNREIVRVLAKADVKAKMLSNGSEAVGNSPAEAAAILKSEMTKWGKLIKDAGIRGE